ncbi:MAG: hypothetical protein ACFHHU_03370 [Porticoccaceae bacterium]
MVANGWYFRDQNEVWLWRQSNQLIQAPKIMGSRPRTRPSFTCSNTFWWYAMATGADYTLTPAHSIWLDAPQTAGLLYLSTGSQGNPDKKTGHLPIV